MNRRGFLAWLAAVPLALGTAWFGRRALIGSDSPDLDLASEIPGTTAGSSGRNMRLAAAGQAGSPASGIEYQAGLPIRLVDVAKAPAATGRALQACERHILAHGTDLGYGNGAIHGVRALGRSLPLGSGDPFRMVLERYTQESYIEGQVFLEVPIHHEGHRHALLKTLVEKECELDLDFQHGGRRYMFGDYLQSARRLHTYNLDVLPIDEQSWTIMALVRVTPPPEARWLNVYGQSLDLDRMIDDTSEQLRSDTQLIRGVDLGAKELPRNCPVFARACGGLHMLYALAAAYSSGYETPERRRAFANHLRTHVRRLTYDLRVIDEVEALNRERVSPENAMVRALDGRLKFLGHSFEIFGLVDQFGLYDFTEVERAAVNRAREQLCRILVESEPMDLKRYKVDRALYDSLVNGFSHAYNGLRMSPS